MRPESRRCRRLRRRPGEALLRVKMVGMCGTDLNTFRGRNAMVKFPRIPGHEVAAEIVEGGGDLAAGTAVTVLALYELRNMCVVPARSRECVPAQPDDGRAARWRDDGVHQRSAGEAVPLRSCR